MSKIALILLSPLLLAACQSGMYFATESPSGELVEQPVLPLAPSAEAEPLGRAELEVSPGPRGEGGDALDVRVSMARFDVAPCELSLAGLELFDDAGRSVPGARPEEGPLDGPLLAVGEVGQGEAAFRFILEPGALDDVDWVLLNLHWWVSGQEVHDEIRFEKIVPSSGSPGFWSFAFGFSSFSSGWGGNGGGHHHHHSRRSPDSRRGPSSTPSSQVRRSPARSGGGGGKRSRR